VERCGEVRCGECGEGVESGEVESEKKRRR
jgi:hypothetical protein